MKTFNQYITEERLKNGLGDNMSPEEIAKKHDVKYSQIFDQIIKGIKVEFEHTNKKDNTDTNIIKFTNKQIENFVNDERDKFTKLQLKILEIAYEITRDHLVESPTYYDDLANMETRYNTNEPSPESEFDQLADEQLEDEQKVMPYEEGINEGGSAFKCKSDAQDYCKTLSKVGIKCKPKLVDKIWDYWTIEYDNEVTPKEKPKDETNKKAIISTPVAYSAGLITSNARNDSDTGISIG